MAIDSTDLRGFGFPFRIDPATGGVAASTGTRKLRDNLRFLLETELGERVLRRDYGGGLRGLVNEPVGTTFFALIKSQLIRAVVQHEPRIELVSLDVRAGAGTGDVEIELHYVERATQTVERLGVRFGPNGFIQNDGGVLP